MTASSNLTSKISFKSVLAILAIAGLSMQGICGKAEAFQVEVADAPTNNLALILSAIKSAQNSLLINIYEFSEPEIADAIQERILHGVHVEILQEGQPVGGVSAAARGIQSQLISAMQQAGHADKYFEMHANAVGKSKRRYRFDHAKYMVIDGESLYIGSENYSPSGHPQPGSTGNRGWDVFIHDSQITQAYARTFGIDTDTTHGDIITHVDGTSRRHVATSAFCDFFSQGCDNDLESQSNPIEMLRRPPRSKRPIWTTQPVPPVGGVSQLIEADAVEQITSPDTSLSGLMKLVQDSRTSLDLEQMDFFADWKGTPDGRSPLLDAALEAARRGVRIRILLNDDTVFSHGGDTKNKQAVRLLNSLAQNGRLPIVARIANLRAMGVTTIHNKGALSDGSETLISSINWNQNSITNNREAAVRLSSSSAYAYFEALFDRDWKNSEIQGGGDNSSTTPPDDNPDPIQAQLIARAPSFDCPDELKIQARVGELKIGDSDASFESLDDTMISGRFIHDTESSGCLLLETTDSDDISAASTENHKLKFVQIRGTSSGHLSIALDGYTSRGKLYSIRSILENDSEKKANAGLHAFVYDASGLQPKKLGTATLQLK